MLKIISLFIIILFNTIVGASVATVAGFSPESGAFVLNVISLIPTGAYGVLTATLYKQIWLSDLMEAFIPNWSFLSTPTNMDQFVEYDKINLAEAGIDPAVLINNTAYPVPFAERSDVPGDIVLDVYDTEGTVIRKAELVELSYDKRGSIVANHKKALLNKFSQKAIHAYAPSSNAGFTPVLATSGAVSGGFKVIKFEDILDLKTRFDDLDAPEDRTLVLTPAHFNQLAKQDLVLMKAVMAGSDLFGFKLFNFSKTPKFNKLTGVKIAFGAAADPEVDTIASIAWCNSEVMRAQGTFNMFERLNDPEQKGDIINFQMRGVALPKRSKMIAALYSAPA